MGLIHNQPIINWKFSADPGDWARAKRLPLANPKQVLAIIPLGESQGNEEMNENNINN